MNALQNKIAGTSFHALLLTSSMVAITMMPSLHGDEIKIDTIVRLHPSQAEHITQAELNALLASDPLGSFHFAFSFGDEMFETDFGFSDGGGANVGNGERTTRIPRADLNGPGQWASHLPMRATGPNASSCSSCHFQPVADGAGDTASDVHRDPFHLGDVGKMIHRNTPHLHGMGAVQRVAEEMTEDLHAQRNAAISLLSSNRRRSCRQTIPMERYLPDCSLVQS